MINPRPASAPRRWLVGLAPLILAALSVPLLAPTCGGGSAGMRVFNRLSLIIPMDACWQYQTDQETAKLTGWPRNCPAGASDLGGSKQPGNAIRAYGLVYQLIRNGVAVYWIIDQNKTATDDALHPDITVSASVPPVYFYEWATGTADPAAPRYPVSSTNVINYIGGPFVVDGSDYAKASSILQAYKAAIPGVNVHVANVAFQAYAAKTMAGGWSAGGTVPPKLALLDIASGQWNSSLSSLSNVKNSEVVIEGYLNQAGIGTGSAGGTATGTHGQIYDQLGLADFLPATGSTDPTTSNLFRNGYQVLWVPHWLAQGSCADVNNCLATSSHGTATGHYTQAQIDQVLATIKAFGAAGHDIFAECAGIGSFEGVQNPSYQYPPATSTPEFQASAAISINPASPAWTASYLGNFASPLMQIGDFPFKPYGGVIQQYQGPYRSDVVRLIADKTLTTWDYFTLQPGVPSGKGTVVYLAGHSYSGSDGTFQIAGSRLVLNTLFNLGAACVSSGVSCQTGQLGVCGQGVLACDSSGNQVCAQVNQPSPEICNGLDDDCNGMVDDGLTQSCYDGPPATRNKGSCHDGVRTCQRNPDGSYAMSACVGEVLPQQEVCNGLDDDCDGYVDNEPGTTSDNTLEVSCYFGPSSSLDPTTGKPMGICQAGVQTCTAGSWGDCAGQVLPNPIELCGADKGGNGLDDNCNGLVDETCNCTVGATQQCFAGPKTGACLQGGTQTCQRNPDGSISWGPCVGAVAPQPEICGNGIDDDCNGIVDDPSICNVCPPKDDPSRICYVNADHSAPQGVCANGTRSCSNGVLGDCSGTILPSPELCDGKDNDCNGIIDDGPPPCSEGNTCVNGICVRSSCTPSESPCPLGYYCAGTTCLPSDCGGGVCPPGERCIGGTCVDSCAGVNCGPGTVCAGGLCTGGSCYVTGCPTGQICQKGQCVSDPCTGITCPSGTFCRAGDCVQACAFVSCLQGQRCSVDGFCVDDPCIGKTCPGQICRDGACVPNPCLGVDCGVQACADGVCVDDPCTGVVCPVGQCSNGQCYSKDNMEGLGTLARETSGSGCGCGTGEATPLAALLLAALAPVARRRRRGGAILALLLAGVTLVAAGCTGSAKKVAEGPCTETCGGQCTDTGADPANCGGCGRACAAGSICVSGVCGSGGVAPFISRIDPGSLPKGAIDPVQVDLYGERFASGATLRTSGASGAATLQTEFVDASHLRARIDLETASPGTALLRIVNPDRVISNAISVPVAVPSPVVSAIDPAIVTAGTTLDIKLTGTGLIVSSACYLSGGAALPPHPVSTTLAADGSLHCAPGVLQPGTYDVWIVNDGNLSSNHKPLTVASATPTVTALDPTSSDAGTTVSLTVLGTGFDITSTILFDQIARNTSYIDPTHLYAQIDLGTCYSGPCAGGSSYGVVVRNGSGAGAKTSDPPVMFLVGASAARILSVSPQTAYQGQKVTITFTAVAGTQFPAGTTIEVSQPGGAFGVPAVQQTPPGGPVASVSGVLDLAGQPEGQWAMHLAYPASGGGFAYSEFYPLRVLSNVAVLASSDQSGGPQGATLSLTLDGSNFFTGIAVHFLGPSGLDRTLPTSITATTPPRLSVTGLSLVDLDTGLYQLAAVNVGTAPSNKLPFTVTPGPPTVTSVSPTAAPQSSTPVSVTITGTNFAKPDATGVNGSVVHAAAPSLGVTDYVVPASATTVVDPTTIQISFDTRAAIKGTYNISVWNPGGNPPPQKSNADKTFTIQ